MKARIQRFPFPFVGYMLILLGFASLGVGVATAAYGLPQALYFGLVTLLCYAAGVGCFVFRGRQMRHADPADATVLHFDPMVPESDRREVAHYLHEYRGLDIGDDSTSSTGRPLASSRRVP
ncbi:hypothetical protein [Mycolicibacterium mengxianglii]|uniref:hypothetical protein n=1 Tax=Mycolicibacterium mengxianglii TaxID=2736649 RepID=UPI0018D18B60|nr:hypothetical protein [Mycolicibacterium mengxianglii]